MPLSLMTVKSPEGKQKMSDDYCFFNKETLIIKPPKKSPLVLRRVVLAISIICGVYIFLTCLKQIDILRVPKLMKNERTQQHCHGPPTSQFKDPYVHYPKPIIYTRDGCACTPVRFFAILSMQRSGSGWFETLMNSHVNISSNGEIFSVKERRTNVSVILKTLDKVYNLDWYSSASKNECTAAVGFKWMLNQGLMEHHDEICEYFNRKGVSAIFLFRRNQLRRLVSLLANDHDRDAKQLNGTHKAHVHSRDEADVLAKYKPMINSTLLIPILRHTDKVKDNALEYFKSTRHIVLYYEDLLQNNTKLRDVQKFLEVPLRRLHSQHVKIHTRPLSEQIENWDAVYAALKGTQYESFLNADD